MNDQKSYLTIWNAFKSIHSLFLEGGDSIER